MSKKLFSFVLLVVLGVGVYFGVTLYKSLRNTPERTTQTFVQDLQAGNIDWAYDRLSTNLKQGREQYWKDFLGQFKANEGEATLVSHEYVDDSFNTYPTDGEPQRFVYKFRLQGRDYLLNCIVFKAQGAWAVGELLGSYK